MYSQPSTGKEVLCTWTSEFVGGGNIAGGGGGGTASGLFWNGTTGRGKGMYSQPTPAKDWLRAKISEFVCRDGVFGGGGGGSDGGGRRGGAASTSMLASDSSCKTMLCFVGRAQAWLNVSFQMPRFW